ncbi:MAG: response regulator, partial [Deltaproteobacteria bacterium]|nr:response regulator [Deltaproteobacteria bacterium]
MNGKANILIVDDELGPRESLRMILSPHYSVHTAERGGEAIEILGQVPVDLVTLDLKMPSMSGIKLLEKVKQHDPDIEAIIITGYGSLDTAVDGLRMGAFDYVSKPFDVNHILSQVNRALERRKAKLRLKQIKSDFLTNVSHELRTPLSVVLGFISLLLDRAIGNLSDEQQAVMEKIYKSSEELLVLIDNVLWLGYLNAGDTFIVAEEVDACALIRESVEKYEKSANEKGIKLDLELPQDGMKIMSDPSKVSRIFQNLYHNALKFTQQGQINVKVQWSANQESVEIKIEDTGVGIPQEQMKTIFQPFQQLTNPNREVAGLGLGLTVASQLTDYLGGTLQITSQPGTGTHALLKLPCQL